MLVMSRTHAGKTFGPRLPSWQPTASTTTVGATNRVVTGEIEWLLTVYSHNFPNTRAYEFTMGSWSNRSYVLFDKEVVIWQVLLCRIAFVLTRWVSRGGGEPALQFFTFRKRSTFSAVGLLNWILNGRRKMWNYTVIEELISLSSMFTCGLVSVLCLTGPVIVRAASASLD